ncbi:hypothetical protein FRC09_015006 [Ceratobasidium sp. 395]|nr:hypothetical protein FRC09_015006 [Ceratobasidium sp. 395]
MPSKQMAGDKQRFRNRIREVKLQPDTSAYDIIVEIHVDGARVHRLPLKKKGEALKWTDLCLPCDVHEGSTFAAQVTEVHTIRDRTDRAMYHVSRTTSQGVISIACNEMQLSVQVSFLSKEQSAKAYSEAFEKARRLEQRPGIVEKAGKVGDAFKVLLELGSTMAEVSPEQVNMVEGWTLSAYMAQLDPTGGAKVAFSLCTKAWECLEKQEKQDASMEELVGSIARAIPSIDSVKGIADANLSLTVTAMLNLIEDVSLFILSYKPQSALQKAWRASVGSEDQERMQTYITEFKALRSDFDTGVSVQAFRAGELERLYTKLKPADLAGYDPARRCIEGTRVDVIEELVVWTHRSNAHPRLAWVHGPAGFGKSSIATSLCLRLDGRDLLASSFFCKRDSPELRDPRRVLTTIVYGLALRWQPYRDAVVAAVRDDPELHSRHIQPLYDTLVGKPQRKLAQESGPGETLVVVVDALDECGDLDTRRQLLACLHDLSKMGRWLKVVLTSRPDPDIQEFFREAPADSFVEYDVAGHDASADIRVFVEDRLKSMTYVKNWPANAVDEICLRSSGLFIWARTACKFILDGLDRPSRLKQVLAGSRLADIDLLYSTAVVNSVPDAGGDNLACMRLCLGAVVVVAMRTPLSVTNLALLLHEHVSRDIIERVIANLSSVLYVDYQLDDVVRIFHPSFMDFITHRSRSGDLCVNLQEQNTILASHCLEALIRSLKFNICGLETSDRFNSDVPDLDSRVEAAIGPHLGYSCLYWSSHLTDAKVDRLETCLRELLSGRTLLYWIEALSLLGKLATAPASLLAFMACRLPDSMQDCRTTANDAYRFVLSFYDAISRSTPHLYVSALAFAPCDSGMTRRMRGDFPKLLTIAEGAGKEWTPCLRTIWVSSEVHSTAYSPDSRRIVSGSIDGKVRIWDAETGDAVLGPLIGHSGEVNSVAFSPDGHWIASGSDDETIRLWDAEAGTARGEPLRGHEGWVHSVAFSPIGCQIASGSVDKTVRTWDTETGQSTLVMSGHSDAVWSVAFSPDGRRLVSGSVDKTLRIWDAETGASVLESLLGHSDHVCAVAFSPDGHQIVSGSADGTVRIWDARTGRPLLDPLQGHSSYVCSVAFSVNSLFIVSGSADNTVRIWDAQSGAAVGLPLDGHSGSVRCVAFSSDGSRVVSGSSDKTMRIWDIFGGGTSGRTQESAHHNAHSGAVNSVAFSSNGQRVASGSGDKTVCVWHAETGTLVLGPLEGHTDAVRAVTFSSDNRRIASGSYDCTVRIWDSETGMPVLDPLRGHSGSVQSVAFSPDCRLIASGSSDETIRVWDAKTGHSVLQPLTDHSNWIESVAFSADGRRIVSGALDKTVRVWDAETGQAVLGPLADHSNWVTCAAFSPDGRRIVSGSWDETVRIWDAETGNPVHDPLEGHTGVVQSVAFSPDGRRIVSGSSNNTVRIWDTETGNAVLEPLLGHSDQVRSVAFSPNGRRVVSGSDDMTVRIWDVETHTGSSDKTPRLLHGTHVPTISQDIAGDRVLVNSAQLARHMHPEQAGWVTSTEGKPIVWLPPELRDIDDSIICISAARIRRPIVVDFTNFVHGTSWTSILGALD